MTASHAASSVAPEPGRWRSRVARFGLVGRALLYATLALLAADVATGGSSSSTAGAIEQVARAPYGRFLLIVLAVTLVALVAWKVLQAVAGDPIEGDDVIDRAQFAGQGAIYAGSALAAVSIVAANWGVSVGSGGGGGESTEEQAASWIMDWPGGRWIVAAVGVAIIGYTAYKFWEDVVGTSFMERLRVPDAERRQAVEQAGRAGYAARSAISGAVGLFFVIAGLTADPDEAGGLSQLLRELSSATAGQALLWAMAAGLIAFGAFTLAEAVYRRAT